MQTYPTQLSDVIYNAATQCFEALVTVHDGGIKRKYACALDAPITMSFEDAAHGLAAQAQRQHGARYGLKSPFTASRARPRTSRRRFDTLQWLESLITPADQNAA